MSGDMQPDMRNGAPAGNRNETPQQRKLKTDDRVDAAVALLAALTSSSDGTIAASEFARSFALTTDQLDEVIEGLQLLADDYSGVRAVLYRAGDRVVLEGDSARLSPLRLTADEASALMSVIARFKLSSEVREHIQAAIGPLAQTDLAGAPQNLASDSLFGTFFQVLSESISYGIRIEIAYRAAHDTVAVLRVVDPGYLEVAGDAAYLIAWDVEKDAQRRYRLDRIESVMQTEDSVQRHAFVRESAAESLRAVGKTAYIRFASRELFETCVWAGLDRTAATAGADGVSAPVSYTSEPWLFDQVVSAGGDIVIEKPADLRQRFTSYARGLLATY